MQQIPIEEVLIEFRKKYADSAETQPESESESEEIAEAQSPTITDDAFPVRTRGRRNHLSLSLLKIIAVQGVVAVVAAVAVIILRMLS
jgi:hypothetical protein